MDIRLDTEATVESVLEFGADVVVVATGAEAYLGMEGSVIGACSNDVS